MLEQAKEIVKGDELTRGMEILVKLRWYNYAESFLARLAEEIERDSLISERTARRKVYREMKVVGGLQEEDYNRLRKMTSKAEKFYRVVEEMGGRNEMRYLNGISVDAITRLGKKELENLYRKINMGENTEEDDERIQEIIE